MRHRRVQIALACAVLAAIAGTLAGTLTSGGASVRGSVVAVSSRAGAAARTPVKTPAARSEPSAKRSGLRGPRGLRGERGPAGATGATGATGSTGPAGAPAPADAVALPVSLNWFGDANADANGTAGPATVPGIGTLTTVCTLNQQSIVLVPASSAGTRTVADITTFQGEGTSGVSSNQELDSYGASTPITIPLPVNGMIIGTFSVQPDYGAGGPGPSPASFTFSSEMKLNGTGGDGDYCSVAGQVLEHAS